MGRNSRMDDAREMTKRRAQERQSGSRCLVAPKDMDLQFLKAKASEKSVLDVIPFEVTNKNNLDKIPTGKLWYRLLYAVHKSIGPNNEWIVCPRTIGKPCPICEYYDEQMKKNPSKDEKKALRAIKQKFQEAYNVIDLGDKEKGVQILDMSSFTFGSELDKEIRDGDDDTAGFWLPDDGKSIKVRWEEKSMEGGTKFVAADRIDFVERKKQYKDEILEKAYPLDTMLKILEYEDIQRVFMEVIDDDGNGDGGNSGDECPEDYVFGKDFDKEDECEDCKKRRECEKASKKNKKKSKKDEEDGDDECPEDYKFGKDYGAEDECEDCEKKKYCKRAHDSIKNKNEDEDEDGDEDSESKKSKNDDDDDDDGYNGDDCPKGHKFGKEYYKHDECEDCKKKKACREQYMEMKSKEKKSRRN